MKRAAPAEEEKQEPRPLKLLRLLQDTFKHDKAWLKENLGKGFDGWSREERTPEVRDMQPKYAQHLGGFFPGALGQSLDLLLVLVPKGAGRLVHGSGSAGGREGRAQEKLFPKRGTNKFLVGVDIAFGFHAASRFVAKFLPAPGRQVLAHFCPVAAEPWGGAT